METDYTASAEKRKEKLKLYKLDSYKILSREKLLTSHSSHQRGVMVITESDTEDNEASLYLITE